MSGNSARSRSRFYCHTHLPGFRSLTLGVALAFVPVAAESRPKALVVYGMPKAGPGTRSSPLFPAKASAMRGVTLGPIESQLQPGRGYGSASYATTLRELQELGANWVSLTVFGRVYDLQSSSVDPAFEAPLPETLENLSRAAELAHSAGLKVMLVPHLWVESGKWRAELDPKTEEGWQRFRASYGDFVKLWAAWAEKHHVELFSTGVELRFWVTSSRAPTFLELIDEVRSLYHGPLTYASNWDDADDTEIWRHLDIIGVNGFYPLHWEKSPTNEQLSRGAQEAARRVHELSTRHEKPVFFNEFGYTARKDSMVEPWLWPEQLGDVGKDENEQSRAYAALLSEVRTLGGFYGAFVWRMYSDVADLSQEPAWGFSPWGKQAEVVLRNAYASPFQIEREPLSLEDGPGRKLLEPISKISAPPRAPVERKRPTKAEP
jgi:hypothetical protein